MHDIRLIRDNPEAFDRGLKARGLAPLSERLIAIDEKRRAAIASLQMAQERRNSLSREIGEAKKAKDETRAAALMAEVAKLKEEIPAAEEAERVAIAELDAALAAIPNTPKPDVPIGEDEMGNVERHNHGVRRNYSFQPKQHFELGEASGLMDFETAAKLSGSRFTVLKGGLARLSRALGQFMLDLHTTEHGYTEVNPPLLVRDPAVFGVGQLPKFEEDLFRTTDGRWLISTAEVTLTNFVRDSIVSEDELPMRLTALTPCFRSEAGAAGKDTRGMLRQHQFEKVELVSITTPEQSADEHERMLACAEAVLRKLDLHYRVVTLCTGDMGFASAKTYDIEVWLPGQGAYREISSCSVCTDFQARRMNARYRPKDGKAPRFVHTLNGSGTAVGRALIAVMETWQNEDGSVTVPPVLEPYMGGITRIEKAA
ncbi:serine--tRNA ligase [Chelatococcus sp. SYSU_G07232]|uniref:Serine--tRNA ligase n=1 Tax=Chelatococcus albus TaxID=3047466 RepID=A0ABT7ACN2_9HYPH|nr:serine--tRNA ligase [Chelatococcus sp. SYSU_G07232]MDJ1157130.1 serine--tRNA ligase [Chelatococcus sp. SYSU_G07232]